MKWRPMPQSIWLLRVVLPSAVAWLAAMCFIITADRAAAQDSPGDGRRSLWDDAFLKKRPVAAKSPRPQPPPAYQLKTAPIPPIASAPAQAADAVVGVTIWRLRKLAASDDAQASLAVTGADGRTKGEWMPERVDAATTFSAGEHVRLSIEVPRTGFLYVVDHEQYAGGKSGEPYLIFPTRRIRGGDNAVTAGRVIELPTQDDTPPYFTLQRSRPDQTAEAISLLITPQPMAELPVPRDRIQLSEDQFQSWEKKWGSRTERFELVGGVGRAWTKAEKEAGANGARLLVQEEPAPQTLYHLASKPGEPLLITVPLKIRK